MWNFDRNALQQFTGLLRNSPFRISKSQKAIRVCLGWPEVVALDLRKIIRRGKSGHHRTACRVKARGLKAQAFGYGKCHRKHTAFFGR